MKQRERVPTCAIVASEPLSSDPKDWVQVSPQSILLITADSDFLLYPY